MPVGRDLKPIMTRVNLILNSSQVFSSFYGLVSKFYRQAYVADAFVSATLPSRMIFLPMVATTPARSSEPGFGGDDGEPELQYEAFIFAFFRDRARFRKGETKRVRLKDPYSYSLLTAPAERSRRVISRMWHRDIGSFDNLRDRQQFYEQYLGRTSDIDQPTLDDTESFKSLAPGTLAPAGYEMGDREQGVAEFLASNPGSRIALNRGSTSEAFSAYTPYSFGSRYNRYSFGHRQTNRYYNFMRFFHGKNERYLNPSALGQAKTQMPWYRSDRPNVLVRPNRSRTLAHSAFHRQVARVKYDDYVTDVLPTSGRLFGRDIRSGFGQKKLHTLPAVPNKEVRPKGSPGLKGLSFSTDVVTAKPLSPKYCELYLDLDENEPIPKTISEDWVYFVNASEEEIAYYRDVPRHTNYNSQLSFTPYGARGGYEQVAEEDWQTAQFFEDLYYGRHGESFDLTTNLPHTPGMGSNKPEASFNEPHFESLSRWFGRQGDLLDLRAAKTKLPSGPDYAAELARFLGEVDLEFERILERDEDQISETPTPTNPMARPATNTAASGFVSLAGTAGGIVGSVPVRAVVPAASTAFGKGRPETNMPTEAKSETSPAANTPESAILKNHPLGIQASPSLLAPNRKQVQPFSTMYPETP